MNKKHTLALFSRKEILKFASIFYKSSKAFSVLSLIITAALIFSATINIHAVCQTPQFGLPIILNVNRPVAAASGDFNGDRNIDFAILKNNPGSGSFNGTIELFIGDGNGNFTSTGIQYNAVQRVPTDVVKADFNNDGNLDLAVSGYSTSGGSTSGVSILIGNGNGEFSQPTLYPLSISPSSIAVGDFNNDSNTDVIAKGLNDAAILPGLGNGNLSAGVNISTGNGGGSAVAVRDFNNDGLLDFVTANTSSTSQTISIKLGSGSFVFSSPPPINLFAETVAANDFNRDGKMDFAALTRNSNSAISIYLGNGNGNFNSPNGSPFATGNFSENMISADFNSDNIPDIANTNFSTSNSLSIFLNNGNGIFSSQFNFSPEQSSSEELYPVDFDKNGAMDLAIIQQETQNKVVLLRNTCPPPNKTKFDFDGDAKTDISVFRPSNGTWYLNQSTNGFTGVAFGLGTDRLTPADFDSDGKTDVGVFRDGAWYYLRSSDNNFVSANLGIAGDIPVPADFDGDGRADISVFRPSSGIWYRINSTNGSLFAILFGANGDKPLVADFDGDGKSDIALFRPTSNGIFYSLDSSTGQFKATAFGLGTDIPTMGDFDGDSKTDIAVFRPSNGAWYRFNSSNGAFIGITFGQNGDIPVTGDYDGDGKADIAVFRPNGGAWYYLNSSNSAFVGFGFGAGTDKPIPAAFQ